MVGISILKSKTKEAAMKINLSLSIEDAQRLLRILHDVRHVLSVNAASVTWGIPGVPDLSLDLSDIVLMEDIQCDLLEKLDEDNLPTHFAGCLQVF